MPRPPVIKIKRTAFGEVLRTLRMEAGVSQSLLAARAGVSAGYVGLIETGHRGGRPSLDITKRFSQAVNANIEQTERLLRAAGHLGPDESLIQDGRPSFAAFVDSEPLLSRGQKKILKDMYRSWIGP